MKPKLIMLNGPAAVGKTTIANMYANNHPRTLNLAGDVLIEMISHWRDHEDMVRRDVFMLTNTIVETYLRLGHDVVVQYLLTDAADAETFSHTAAEAGAEFYEILLDTDKKTAVERLLRRGVWGEQNSPALTEADIPVIEDLYDRMTTATNLRPDTKRVLVREGEVAQTYTAVVEILNAKK